MDAKEKKICGLLKSPDNIRRCAAAIVLAEVAPRDPGVVKALGESLASSNEMLTGYVLEALDAIGSPAVVPYVMPLLDADEVATKLRAVSVIARAGSAVVPRIRERLATAAPRSKIVLADLLARIQTKEAFDTLLAMVEEPENDVWKEVCEAVRRHIGEADTKARTARHKQVMTFMQRAGVRNRERSLAAALLLLGVIGRPEAKAAILKHVGPETPPLVRRHALAGLRDMNLSSAAAGAVTRKLLPYLSESDETLVREVLEVLDRHLPPASSATTWDKLLASHVPAVRSFGARKLAGMDSAAANRRLLTLLKQPDNRLSEMAARALASHTGAQPLLLEALAKETDGDTAWCLVRILEAQVVRTSPDRVRQFSGLALQAAVKKEPRQKALLHFVRALDAHEGDRVLYDAGMQHRKARRWADAVDCLKRLIGSELFDADLRYHLSVCNLKVSDKDVSPAARSEDHALRGFHGLVGNRALDPVARLRKEKVLDAEELLYIGFHFSEMTGAYGDFGCEVLGHVVRTWPRTKAAKAARNKLKLVRPAGKRKARTRSSA